jgi:serine/threonine protein kinase
LGHLAQNHIVHRDIKVSNIFLSKNGIPKIADFGFAIKANTMFRDVNIGSPLYMSPESLIYRQYGPKTDIWSFGVLIYELVTGETPLEKCKTDE